MERPALEALERRAYRLAMQESYDGPEPWTELQEMAEAVLTLVETVRYLERRLLAVQRPEAASGRAP